MGEYVGGTHVRIVQKILPGMYHAWTVMYALL